MIIIDTHTHIFPDTSANRVLEFTAKKFNVKIYGKGTAADLISQMDVAFINEREKEDLMGLNALIFFQS